MKAKAKINVKRKKKRKQPCKTVVHRHHITYNPEWVVPIFKGEHWLISLMNRRKKTSVGFITALKEYIRVHEATAQDLSSKPKKNYIVSASTI